MRIGFDLDGVLVEQDVCLLQVMRCLEEHKNLAWAREWYYRGRKLLLDPKLFMGKHDEGYIITCRVEELRKLTEYWCEKYVPQLKLIYLPSRIKTGSQTFRAWCLELATLKSQVINKLKLDVYFEDIPNVVFHLRKLCPNTKIIQFGHDIYEGVE